MKLLIKCLQLPKHILLLEDMKIKFLLSKSNNVYEKVWGKDHFRTAYAKRDRAFNLEYDARNGDDKSSLRNTKNLS